MSQTDTIQDRLQAAYEDGAFHADMFMQSLHDHGAEMGELGAALAFHETMSELIGECADTDMDTANAKRLEGFLSRTGARLWQLVCREGEA